MLSKPSLNNNTSLPPIAPSTTKFSNQFKNIKSRYLEPIATEIIPFKIQEVV